MVYDTMPTPVGELLLTANEAGLTGVYFEPHTLERDAHPEWRPVATAIGAASAVLAAAREQLEAYFAGARTTFALPLAPRGTPFQQRVWTALRSIDFGGTISYAELAHRIGMPRAVRAVGGANARNPLPIIVPCHRVIGADGSLTGFGGGIERKRWLLRHEGALLA
ncbi:MAG TPA: methylated-DNA--[protein]-cysteine S-methyltransferase [Gemmatimonadaceae bacterium]|nr:methylated-DNA--[protein]-cysteine S-methyltransferase [Gemmatimonadaceae bacterium]